VEQLGDSFAPDRRDDAKFSKVSPDRINHRGLLANKQMPCAVKHQAALLRRRLGGHKPHVGSGDSLTAPSCSRVRYIGYVYLWCGWQRGSSISFAAGGVIANFPPHLVEHFSWPRFLSIQVWLMVLFLVYVTTYELNMLIGDGELYRLFFRWRSSEAKLTRRQRIRSTA